METDFQQWAKELQELILEEDRKIFSARVIDEYLHPKNLKKIADPDGTAAITGPCGDTMYMTVKLSEDRITDIGFLTDGCGPTVACGSVLTQMALGRTAVEAAAIGREDLLEVLGGMPESHLHCVKLAVDTLCQVLQNCEDRGGESDAQR
jgi:nitrogen fixation NifU-like protein